MDDELNISLRGREDDGVRLKRGGESGQPDERAVQLHRAAVLFGDQRISIPTDGLLIGRDVQCDLQLISGLVAPVHARLESTAGEARITDLGSSTGIYLNGEHFADSSRSIRSGDSIAVGDTVLYFVTADNAPLPPVEVPMPHSQLRMDRPQLTLGRDDDNDVVLDHPRVSPHHAEIISGSNGARIKDLSRGGDGLFVNGRLVSRSFLKTGDEIAVGPFRLIFDGQLLQQRTTGDGMRLDAELVRFDVGEKAILHPTTVTMLPGELVAVIGPSGAGKSTLLKSLSGVYQPTGGRVTIDGEPVKARLADLGYVPQDEIVHPLLSVREALEYAAELRLPQDVQSEDRHAAVARVLGEVGLLQHAETRIDSLSGGQRKRAGVASELISQPGMLFLDEPTTGLDPGLEQRLMQLFRTLAEAGRATMIVTHATRSLRLCDKVVVMGEGGHLCFMGAPEEALEFFGVQYFDDLYSALDQHGALAWAEKFHHTRRSPIDVGPLQPPPRKVLAPRPILPQAMILVRRRLKILSRDTRNLWILGLQVPIIGLLLALLFHSYVFSTSPFLAPEIEAELPGLSAQLLFLLVTVALWFGSLASAREIVKERAVMERETAVGVRIGAYLASKAVVLGALTGAQTITLTVIVVALRPVHEPSGTFEVILLLLVLTSWAGVGMGLLVSVSVRSEEQAVSFVPLLLIPQLFFGGSLMPVHQMGVAIKILSKVIVSQWAFAGLGNAINMNKRIDSDPSFSRVNHFGQFFAISSAASALVIIIFLAGCAAVLHDRLRRRSR